MFKKEGMLSKIIGIALVIIIIVLVIVFKNKDTFSSNVTEVYGAIGGGKEDLLGDEDINKIFADKYEFELVQDPWSNGKTVRDELVRKDGSAYDLVFFSDQRYYDYYKTPAQTGEVERKPVLAGDITLNTPIVIYSWKEVVDVLIKNNIVEVENGVHYITKSGMRTLIDYILEGKKWSDIGLESIYGSINIGSVDPVTSSPGATYYGLLLSIMVGDDGVTDATVQRELPKLKKFYIKSGYMNNTPADLFSMFLKTGMGAKPMIVDYEKSVIDFANSNPDGWNQVKDKVVILYPQPTIWNSHCIAAFTDNGKKLIEGLNDSEVAQIAWSKHGFRVGVTGGSYDVSKINVKGIPNEIKYITPGLKMDYYNQVINYLKEK